MPLMQSAVPEVPTEIRYRPHIDGLRAIAVLAVILYHAGLFGFTGGFVGVDVFFVISGFLITSIILRDLRVGTFSLAKFWERRVRRIFPALFVMVIGVVVAGYFLILYPSDYHHFGSTVAAQAVFASNMLFTVSDNYFDQPSRNTPLLHTWTLAVEEQFYMLFPLLVALCAWWVARRYAKGHSGHAEKLILASVVGVGIASFLINIWFIHIRPGAHFVFPGSEGLNHMLYAGAGFYLLPTRAWELALGAIVALVPFAVRSRHASQVLSLGGVVAVVGSMFVIHEATPFPGVAALVPTLGAVAIIVAEESHRTFGGRLLSLTPLIWIGLISYSLYLWHWPIFVYAKLATASPVSELSATTMLALIVLTFAVAILSYEYVEIPVRKKKVFKSQASVFIAGFISLTVLLILGALIYRNSLSNVDRIPAAATVTLNRIRVAETNVKSEICFQLPADQAKYPDLCRIGDKAPHKTLQYVVWGDSHAYAITPLLDELGKRLGVQGALFYYNGCIPLFDVWIVPRDENCDRSRREAIAFIEEQDIKNVFLIAEWSSDVMGGPDRKMIQRITDSNDLSRAPELARDVLARHLLPLADKLSIQGRSVYVMEQVPAQYHLNTRTMFYEAVHAGAPVPVPSVTTEESKKFGELAGGVMEQLKEIPGVLILNPAPILCGDLECPLEKDGSLIYRDNNHISPVGMKMLEPLFTPIFKRMGDK